MLAFGGAARLEGTRLVRLVYNDESGLASHEPYIVVAGVMIDADNELIAVEEHIESLVHKHIPEKDWDGFIFHASDIWSGKKYFENRDEWPWERRFPILADLAATPAKFDLPITMGHYLKSKIPGYDTSKTYSAEELIVAAHALAFAGATMNVERLMREQFPDEVALLIAEDNATARLAIKEAHALYRNEKALKDFGGDPSKIDCFPLKRIRDIVHFAKKPESRPLQLADICAFVIKGHLEKRARNAPLYESLSPLMIVHPKDDAKEA